MVFYNQFGRSGKIRRQRIKKARAISPHRIGFAMEEERSAAVELEASLPEDVMQMQDPFHLPGLIGDGKNRDLVPLHEV